MVKLDSSSYNWEVVQNFKYSSPCIQYLGAGASLSPVSTHVVFTGILLAWPLIQKFKFSRTLPVKEWDDHHKYGGCFHSSKLCDGGGKINITRGTPRLAGRGDGCGRAVPAWMVRWDLAPRFAGAQFPFVVLIFGDLVPKSARYGSLNPNLIGLNSDHGARSVWLPYLHNLSASTKEVGLTSLYT